MKKILLSVFVIFVMLVGVTFVGCGEGGIPNGEEIVEPIDPTPVEPTEPTPEEPKEDVDFTEVIASLKYFLDGSFVFTENYESEILSDKAYIKVNADDALPVEDIAAELSTFSVEGFTVECYEEDGKIVFAILAQ